MVLMNQHGSRDVPFRGDKRPVTSKGVLDASHDDVKRPPAAKPRAPRRLEVPARHQVMYKPCRGAGRRQTTSVAGYAGVDRETVSRDKRRDMNRFRPGNAPLPDHAYTHNPAAPPARPWRPMTWLPRPPQYENVWKEEMEEKSQERDNQQACSMGYETLVVNLLHITIPGTPELNRSWQNFLSDDEMEWGFPYNKGTWERARCCQPQVYLAHQLKEKLWKYPKARSLQIQF